MRLLTSLSTFLLSAALGCDAPSARYLSSTSVPPAMPRDQAKVAYNNAAHAPASEPVMGAMMGGGMMRGMMGMGLQAEKPAQAVDSPALARKIVYDAQIDLITENVDPIARKLTALVREARGYIAEEHTTGSPGAQRSMHWKIRVPVDQFDSFVTQVVALGELERNSRTSQDVTEQYYDIEARIKNKKAEEKTITRILEERTGKLEDVLKVEVELSRVRGEIEQLEGKMRVLENLSSLASLTLNVREREKFQPPPPVAADFPTQIARTWTASVQALVDRLKAIVLWVVDWAIWAPLVLASAILGWLLARWLIRLLVRNLPRLIALARTPIIPPRSPSGGQ